MKKLFLLLACVAMSMLSTAQINQLVWANGRLLYGTPIESIDSLTYDEMEDIDTLHLLLPRTLIKVVHDTVYIHDTVYVETDCGGEGDTPSAGIGVFSVSADKQVTFSKGNLQYTQSTNTWSFAENQYDYIGTDNVIDDALADKIDLFGWSTSATNFGVSTSTDNADYSGSFVDWGTNKIGNDAPNTWRTLTYDEWYYLRWERHNYSELCGVAQVNGVNGLILLPDSWTCPAGVTFKSGFHSSCGVNYYAAYQTFTAEQWSKLEKSGAIFLPAAGIREEADMYDIQIRGDYGSATWDYSSRKYGLYFFSCEAHVDNDYYSQNGLSVRLVKDIADTSENPCVNSENGHEYVDLGLSVKWATCNVGATKPEEYGDYFAWGEVEPKEEYSWSTYKWSGDTETSMTKYCNLSSYGLNGFTDTRLVLEAEDDAAAVKWGGIWRMPTEAELEELRVNCTWTKTSVSGIDGYQVTGPNGCSIFIPAAGQIEGQELIGRGSQGYFWSSSVWTDIPRSARSIVFGEPEVRSWTQRFVGFPIRPVCE